MIVQVYTNRGNKYVRVVHSYRDPETNKPKMKVIKNYGNLEKLLKQDKNFLEKLEKEIKEKNERLKESTIDKIKKIETNNFEKEGLVRKNYGYLVYEKMWQELGISRWIKDIKTRSKIEIEEILKQLVFQRLLTPSSKKSAYDHRENYVDFRNDLILEDYYRVLDIIYDEKEKLEKHLNSTLKKKFNRELNVVLYDVTTYYFESVKKDEIKGFGFSKDNKVNQVQVVMGLLIDNNGIPVGYELYPGNTSEFSTLYPVIKDLKEKYKLKKVIVAADRGLNSGKNLLLLKELGLDYVMAYKLKGAKKEIKEKLFEDGYTIEKEFKYKLIEHVKEIRVDGKVEKIQDNLLLGYSEKNLDIELDVKQIEEAEKMDGFFAIEYSQKELTGREVREIYGSLWKIEDSFRVLKTNLEARPIFVWSEKRIRAHFLICYLALVIERYLEKLLKDNNVNLSTAKIQEAIRNTTLGSVETLMGDYYIKDAESKEYLDIINSVKMNKIPLVGYVSDIKKCI